VTTTTFSTAHGRHPAAPLAAASVAVTIWGIGPLFVRAIGTTGLTVATYRLVLGIPIMFAILLAQGGTMTWRVMRAAAPAGVLFALDIGLGFSSFQHTSIANATLLGALSPLLVLVVAGPLFGDRLRRVDYLWFVAALVGTVMIVIGGQRGGDSSLVGDAMALGSCVAWTAYFVYLKKRRLDGMPAFAFMTAVITTGAIVILPYALLTSPDLRAVHGTDFVWLLALIIGPGAVGHGLMTWATRYINVNVSSLMILAGPVVSTIGAYLCFDETLKLGQLVGGAIVLGSLGLVLVGHSRAATIDGTPQPLEGE
jgi:drug/metabolite transporter (DMT)-like permease